MSIHDADRRGRASVRAIRAVALAALLVAGVAAPRASAQQDTAKHTMPGMPGMKMPMPAPKAPTAKPAPKRNAKAPARKPTAPAARAKAASRPGPAAAKARVPVKTGAPTKVAVPTHEPGHVMEPMPGMADTSHAHMRAMHDSAHAHMPAMQHRMIPDTSAHDTTHAMPGMPAMPGMAMQHASDTTMHGMAGMKMIDGPLGIPMERTGSGTSWLPDESPMHAYHRMSGAWELMLHGVAFAMYDKQGSRRGDEQFSSVNWGMLMATRELRGGRLQLRGMLSAEPWTVGGRGYPLLLQTGETFQGEPLHDRQHPHDLFMELAGLYEHAIADRLGVSLYLAPVGEPAIGPVAFPHRPSAMNDPMAPLSHHWQDATHIAFGVVTAGIFTHSLRLEGSIFNGREPDENRTNFDYRGRSLDSYAGRLAWNPTSHWSLSGSYAYIKSPEPLAPDDAVHRISASIMNGHTFGQHGELATTFVYGANRHSEGSHLEPSYLLESNLEIGGAHSVFGRAEHVQKSAEDLALGAGTPTGEFDITSLVAGYVYEFDRAGNVRTGIGGRASLDLVPTALEPHYGTRTPRGFAIYVRFRPQRASEGHDKRIGALTSHGHGNHP